MRRFALLLLVLSSLACHAGSEYVAAIPVVHTWGDLISHRALSVEDDQLLWPKGIKRDPSPLSKVKVQIGISDDHVAAHGGLLLYCLSRGVAFAGDFEPTSLGPFMISVHPVNQAALQQAIDAVQEDSGFALLPTTYAFKTQTIPFAEAGDYVVEVVQRYRAAGDTAPKVIARTTVHVVKDDSAQPWSPWGFPEEAKALQQAADADNTTVSADVANPGGGTAVPKPDQKPRFFDDVPWLDSALPQLIPEKPDPQTHLKLDGNTLVLTAANLDGEEPEEHCLTRWWVNGKPWTPPAAYQLMQKAEAGGGAQLVGNPTAYVFAFQFDPKPLGAKKGDKIGVQVLYCPNRYVLTDELEMLQQLAAMLPEASKPPTDYSSMSNRVSFTYSGAPKHLVRQ